jgi:hypothetical protein
VTGLVNQQLLLQNEYLAAETRILRAQLPKRLRLTDLRNGRVALHGFGTTVNISSGGVLVSVNDSFPIGGSIELAINWPFLLDGLCPLKLKIRGCVVRSGLKEVAVQFHHLEFRTSGINSTSGRPSDNKVRRLGA